jgi:hypothetical protein
MVVHDNSEIEFLKRIDGQAEQCNPVRHSDLGHYCEVEYSVSISRGWGDSFILRDRIIPDENKRWAQDNNIEFQRENWIIRWNKGQSLSEDLMDENGESAIRQDGLCEKASIRFLEMLSIQAPGLFIFQDGCRFSQMRKNRARRFMNYRK